MSINKSFGLALREIRKLKKMSQLECSTALGITQPQWSGYELGKNAPTLDAIIEIGNVLKTDPFILIMKSLDHLKYPTDPILRLSTEEWGQIIVEINNLRKKRLEKKLELLDSFRVIYVE